MPWAAAGAVAGALISADSQRSASNKASGATKEANDLQKYMYDQTRQDNMPALDARNSGLAQLRLLLGVGGDPKAAGYGSLMQRFTGANLANDPGYQFGLNQGNQSIERSASAHGGLYSGATMKALQKYGQDYAGTKFNEAFNRNQAQNDSIFNRFASLANLGQTGSSQLAQSGQNYANQVGANQLGLANFQGAAGISQGNQLSNGINQLSAWAARNYGNGGYPTTDGYTANGTGMWYDGPR